MKKIKQFIAKISAFDLIIIAIVIILALFFFFFFNRKSKNIKIRIKVSDQEILYAKTQPDTWYANQFKIGDIERDALGRTVAEIVGIEKFNVTYDQKAVYLDVKIRALYDSRTQLYSVRGRPLIIGTPVRFDFSNVVFNGIVTEIPNSDAQKNLVIKTATVEALLRGVEPKILNSLKKGEKIVDSNGNILVEILKVDIVPADHVTNTDSGELLLKQDPLYKDVYFVLRLRLKVVNGETYIFDNLPLTIGNIAPLNLKYISLFPIITNVTEE